MSYKISAKNRRLKRTLVSILHFLKFEGLHIDFPKKIIIIGVLITFVCLFLNWIDSANDSINGNAFKNVLGIVGYILFILNIKILFCIFDNKIKDFLKSYFHFDIKDSISVIYLGFFGLILTFNTIISIESLNRFSEGIIIGRGSIGAMVGFIFIIIGGFIMLHTKTKTGIYMDNTSENTEDLYVGEKEHEKNNMKLPF